MVHELRVRLSQLPEDHIVYVVAIRGLLLPNKRTCAGFSVPMRALAPEHMSSEVPLRYRGKRYRGLFQFLADVYEAEASV